MRFLNRLARGELRVTRIEAFSDGVFAIVVTLLVLEIYIIDVDQSSVKLRSILEQQWDDFDASAQCISPLVCDVV